MAVDVKIKQQHEEEFDREMTRREYKDITDMFATPTSSVPQEINEFEELLTTAFKGHETLANFKMHTFASDKYNTNYTFSAVYVPMQEGSEKRVGVSIILYSMTGQTGVSPSQYADEMRVKEFVKLPSFGLDKTLLDIAKSHIGKELAIDDDDIVSGKGYVIRHIDINNIDLLVSQAVVIANETLASTTSKGFNYPLDKIFRNTLDKLKNVHYDIGVVTGDCTIDVLGETHFSEWTVKSIAKSNTKEKLNRTNGQVHIGTAYGYIGSLASESKMDIPVPNGQYGMVTQTIKKTKLIPTINFDVSETNLPTISTVLSLLIGMLEVAKRWKEILAQNIKVGRNPGALNQLLDMDNDISQGKKPQKKGVQNTIDKRIADINKAYYDKALLVLDSEKFGFGAGVLSTFVLAAQGDENALDDIMRAVSAFTGGKSVGKISRKEIFARPTIELPSGTYKNRKGQRVPTTMFDELRFAEMTSDEDLIRRYSNALSGKVGTGLTVMETPFDEVVDIYKELDATTDAEIEISSIRTRVFISAEFVNKLKMFVTDSGINLHVPEQAHIQREIRFADNSQLLRHAVNPSDITFGNGYNSYQPKGNNGENPYAYMM